MIESVHRNRSELNENGLLDLQILQHDGNMLIWWNLLEIWVEMCEYFLVCMFLVNVSISKIYNCWYTITNLDFADDKFIDKKKP